MRPTAHSLGGLRFAHRHWGPPSTLAKDHAELALDGYTLSLTVDRAQSRLRCALLCQAGRALPLGMEAQAGLIVYNLLEALRKQHHARSRLDLLVADSHSRRAFDFVGDVLVAHKQRQLRRQRCDSSSPESPDPAPDAASPDPASAARRRQQRVGGGGGGGGGKPVLPAFHFGSSRGDGEGDGEKEEEDGEEPIGRVLHWASVMATAPTTPFRPLPRALLSSSSSSSFSNAIVKPAATEAPSSITWTVQPPIGACLGI
jgi:hypothetical protein